MKIEFFNLSIKLHVEYFLNYKDYVIAITQHQVQDGIYFPASDFSYNNLKEENIFHSAQF